MRRNETAWHVCKQALMRSSKILRDPLTASVACLAVHPEEQGVALRRAWVACQGMLQGGNEFVAVQRDHPVVMVRCTHH